MSKYTFERLGTDKFEALVQALLEKQFRTQGTLSQFGPGKDGGREATWRQPIDHKDYVKPVTSDKKIPKEWVFQAKYHDIGLLGWKNARAEVDSDLKKELNKIVNKHKVQCHKYVLITNVPFSGVRHVGTRDKVNLVISEWQEYIPEIEVWDAIDLSRMLDADADTRTTYLDEILPGDLIRELMKGLSFKTDRLKSAFHAYLNHMLRSERDAKAEEAGDESGLQLEKIFVDLDLKLIRDTLHASVKSVVHDFANQNVSQEQENGKVQDYHLPANLEKVPASFVFLRADYKFMLLKGGPGVGKSTITQFLTLYHSARILKRINLTQNLANQLKLTGGIDAASLDAFCTVRYPLRVELRRYAKWISDDLRDSDNSFLALYLVERINRVSTSMLTIDDLFSLANQNPILLILDGLDEVPQPHLREIIFQELHKFLDRCEGESCDLQVILSTRPQGYRGEFDGFEPMEWHVVELARKDFMEYTSRWLKERIVDEDERADALQRIKDGMKSRAVQHMATTLLQATVMLTIARRKHRIPHARHKLYEKYVDVIFERERIKRTVREWDEELERLHELAGFRLISKMELKKGGQTLDSEEFKQCIHQVIQDYGSTDLGERTIGEVVGEIITLAKDRLCLLAGKGEDQRDIDFIIQPFREYFAAAYLKNHEDADPDHVYESLVERRHVWANVLQFYSAFQNIAQQKIWILEADDTGIDQSSYQGLVRMTKKRRTLMRLLPEFERPRNDHITRTLNNLFADSTKWTWLEQDGISQILEAFAPNESYHSIKKLFTELSVNKPENLLVELDLLAKTAGSKYHSEISEVLNGLMKTKGLRNIVIEVALRNDVKVDVKMMEFQSLLDILNNIRRLDYRVHTASQNNFWSGFSDGQIVDLVFNNMMLPIIWQFLNSQRDKKFQEVYFYYYQNSELRINGLNFMLPFENKDFIGEELVQTLTGYCNEGSIIAPYLKAIALVRQNPHDESLLKEAQRLEDDLKKYIPDSLKLDNQIHSFETGFEDVLSNDWLSHLSLDDGSWITLFVRPEAWHELKSIIEIARFEILMQRAKPIAIKYYERTDRPIHLQIWEAREWFQYDLYKVCICIFNLIDKYGRNSILESSLIFDGMFGQGENKRLSLNQAEELLEKTMSTDDLPFYWNVMILSFYSSCKGADRMRLIDFWKSRFDESQMPYARWLCTNVELVQQLLETETEDSICLASFLRSRTRGRKNSDSLSVVDKKIIENLSELILSTEGTKQYRLVKRLLYMPPSIEGLSMFSNPEIFKHIQDEHWSISILVDDIKEMIISCADASDIEVRSILGKYVENRDVFPIEISLAAIDTLLYIDELSAKPLEAKDWQKDNLDMINIGS